MAVSLAHAQPTLGAVTTAPNNTTSVTSTFQYHSVFAQYKLFNEQPVLPWREANDTVGKIGGWRFYAREASQPNAVDNSTEPKSAPQMKPPARPPVGDDSHSEHGETVNQRIQHLSCRKLLLTLFLLGVLSGCASVNFDQSLAKTNQDAANFTRGQLSLAQTKDQREQLDHIAGEILQKPVGQSDAVRLALVNSPAMQAMLAQNWADAARAAQIGRTANPVFTFLSLSSVIEPELERSLTFTLLDLLTLPQRYGIAQRQIEHSQIRLTSDVIDQVTQVRQSWVKTVAAQQNLVYAQQVYDATQAGAELARRLQSVGNFNKLQRVRQQAFYADAAVQLATAQQTAMSAREELIRILGLTETQAQSLVMPDRLPDLPHEVRSPADVGKSAGSGHRLIECAVERQGAHSYWQLDDDESPDALAWS